MKVLNVGGGAGRDLPQQYRNWEHVLLDIDPAVKPDIVCDAREMLSMQAEEYDAVYCSHTLEHFYRHEVPVVLGGMFHVLKPGGFVDISVPNMAALFKAVQLLDIEDVWYRIPGGQPITFHDVIYGWGEMIKKGNLHYAHKCGFTALSLATELEAAGFVDIGIGDDGLNILSKAHKCP